MTPKDTAAVPSGIGPNLAPRKGESPGAVQKDTAGNNPKTPDDSASGLRSLDTVAVELGIDPKRLRGYIFRNSVRHGDPIGNASLVYDWSLETLRKRLPKPGTDIPTVQPAVTHGR